jgi:hypothetical protein
MFLTNWLRRPRSAKNPRKSLSRPRTRLGMEQLEDRAVLSTLGQIGGAGYDHVVTQTMDSAGNSYLAGTFDQAADFDPGSGTTPWMVSEGTGGDEFVAKYNPDGALAWAKRLGGSLGDIGMRSMAVDSLGNTYLSGSFTGTADFGNNISLTAAAGNNNAYVMKLDPSGSTLWVRTVGGTGSSQARGVAVDGNSVYVTGGFARQADFDSSHSYSNNHDVLKSTGTVKTTAADVFVWRLTADGGFVSAWGFGGTNSDYGQSLFAANGSIYVHGYFSGTADFDPSPASAVNRTSGTKTGSAYPLALFVARYTPDSAGGLSLNWVQTIGGKNVNLSAPSYQVVGDANGLYVPGNYYGTVDFDRNNGVSNAQDTLTSVAGSGDAFVATYNLSNGSLAWVRSIGGPGDDEAGSSVVLNAGMIYVGGIFSQTVDFDPAHFYADNRDLLTSKGSVDGFNWQLNSDGAYVNAWRAGGAGYDRSKPIGVYGGRLYSTGSFEQTADFPTGGTLTSFGAEDIYLMAQDLPAPQIGSFTASPSPTAGSPVTLTAAGVQDLNAGGTIIPVAFYADSNGDGVLDPATDTLLGYGTQASTGTWTFTFTFSTAGTYRLFAQAKDNFGLLSEELTLDLQVL